MPRTLNLDFQLYDKQHEFVYSDIKYTGFVSGIGAGKTTSGAIKALLNGINTTGTGLILAPTYPMLRDSTLRTFRRICGEALSNFNRSEMRGTFVNGNEVLFRSTDDPDHLRGPNIAWIWADEAQLMEELAWQVAEGRLREGIRQAWATFTPNGKLHWTYKVFGKDDATHKLVHATTMENIWLPEDYVHALQTSYTGSFADQELKGLFVDPEGTLFKREWFKVIDARQLPSTLQWVRAWDLALSEEDAGDAKKHKKPDRTATVLAAVDDYGTIYLRNGSAWRKEWPDTRREMIRIAKQEKVPLVIEAVAFQKAAVQEMLREPELVGIDIKGYVPGQQVPGSYDVAGFHPILLSTGTLQSQREAAYADRNPHRDKDRSKVDRARVWQARAENRQISFVRDNWFPGDPVQPDDWVTDCIDEVCDFRADMSHQHDDWVDAISIAMKHLRMPLMVESIRQGGRPTGLAFESAFRQPTNQNQEIVFIPSGNRN